MTAHFRTNHRGSGSEQYPPSMMVALLIYSYATGRFGSRMIEAATHSDVAVRYLCANQHPDHSSICAFRTGNKGAFKAAFTTVLQLAQHLRLTKVGAISIDGTKIQANASKHAAVSYARAGEMIAQLTLEVEELMERAAQAEVRETKDALGIPAELLRRQDRKAALQQAREVSRLAPKSCPQPNNPTSKPSKPTAKRCAKPGKNHAGQSQFPRARRPRPKRNTTSRIRKVRS